MNWSTGEASPAEPKPFQGWSRDQMLVEWANRKKALADATIAEYQLRLAIVEAEFPQATEGTNTIELGNGYKLKCTVKFNYNLDGEKTEDVLAKIANLGNEGTFIADRLVNWKPNLLVGEYRKLEGEYKRLFDEALTIKPGAPQVEIVEPK